MKKLLLVLITGCLMATGCSELLRDELADVHNQIEDIRDELELLKEQMNTNIGALRVLVEGLQSEDFIKSVVPITEGSKVIGYTITFTKSQPITIYHGQDGKDGEDGKDGSTPVIGVKQDNDGAWYWTIDGAWLLDGNGNKVRAEAKDGANGKDGTDGTDGKDGKTPKLKIEDGYWYISVDDGVSWEKLGQATGNPGAPGDSMFSSIDVSDPNKVVFTLQDGTVIVFPTWESFSALQQQVFILNTNLSGLEGIVNALQSQDYITSVVPLVENMLIIGYTINFKNSEPITIYYGKDGKDGSTPVIGVKQDEDGVWYWTIDGEWMTDSAGKKVRASAKDGADGTNGVTPQLKIEEGYWYLSLDKGKTWEKMGQATGDPGEAGDSIFKAIDTSDDSFVVLTLADDSKLIIPRFKPISITIGNGQQRIGISANETISLDYTLSYGDDKTIVTVATDGQFIATIKKTDNTHGILTVSCLRQFVEGTVTVMVSDGNGYMTLSILKLYENYLSSDGTANCYIINNAGTYTFNGTVKGNSSESVGEPVSAFVVWETFNTDTVPSEGDIIDKVSFSDGVVQFSSTGILGNALIAVKDIDNKILWSWHIWVTDYDPNFDFDVYKGHEAVKMMDRNLGAMSSEPGLGAIGLIYEWGRKDPFMAPLSTTNRFASTCSFPDCIVTSPTIGTEGYAAENPTQYILALTQNLDWLYVPNNKAWNSEKSKNDPCPKGWKVPDGGQNSIWSSFPGSISSTSEVTWNSTYNGLNVSESLASNSVWYPAQGYHADHWQGFWQVGYEGRYWTTATLGIGSDYFQFKPDTIETYHTSTSTHYSRANGLPVRCCSE